MVFRQLSHFVRSISFTLLELEPLRWLGGTGSPVGARPSCLIWSLESVVAGLCTSHRVQAPAWHNLKQAFICEAGCPFSSVRNTKSLLLCGSCDVPVACSQGTTSPYVTTTAATAAAVTALTVIRNAAKTDLHVKTLPQHASKVSGFSIA